jgi:CheY-like chemotaxis protein
MYNARLDILLGYNKHLHSTHTPTPSDVDSGSRLKVLVIDDDDITREMLCDLLREHGHDVHELSSAIGASRAISDLNIEAVVLDVMMPSINGDKLARLLRGASRGQTLAIVLISSCPLNELRTLADAARADAVVSKSDARSSLGSALLKAYRKRQLVRASSR